MKYSLSVIMFISVILSAINSIAAEKLYISDSFTITLRTGPSTENKILKILNSGQSLEVLETRDKWSRVKVLLNNDEVLEGWVRNQYLMERVPYEQKARSLSAENQKLKEKLSTLSSDLDSFKKDKKNISGKLNETGSELASLKKEYEALKNASSQYLSLKKDYDKTIIKLNSTEARLTELEDENTSIKKSKNYIWFGIGALVLLFGFIIGSIMGRQTKKRSSYY